MILIFVSFITLIVVVIGSFLISFNFYNYDFSTGINNIFQSKLVNEQNITLLSGYKEYFNSGGNQDLKCYSGTTYQDNNCLFRSLYGFLPPQKTIDLGNFNSLSGSGLTLQLSGNITSGVVLFLRGTNGQGNSRVLASNISNTIPYTISGNYNIKLTNNGDSRVQYFLSLTGSEGFDFTNQYDGNGYLSTSKDFTPQFGGNNLLSYNQNLQSKTFAKSCKEIMTLVPNSLSGDYLLRPSTNPSGITGYCEMTGAGYTRAYDTGTSVSNTKLLLQSETTNGATSFIDSMGNPYTFTRGTVVHSTTQAKFGSSSMYFNGGTPLSISNSSNFDFGNSDFTIDFWTYGSDYTSKTIIGKRTNSGTYGPFLIHSTGFYASSNGTAWDISSYTTFTGGTIPLNQRVHWAVARKGNTIYLFINGIMKSFAVTAGISLISNADTVKVGGDSNGLYFTGYIEELRITKGQALRTANFTPPTMPYRY